MLRDRDIREPLFDFLEEYFGKVRIIEEKTTGRSRADLVMVLPDSLYGIEIKSDADTYARLSRQVKDYDLSYDCNIVVVGSSHGLHIREHVPEYWGVITVEPAEDGLDFYILRLPEKNPRMNWKRKLSILWRPELAQIQEWNGMPKYKDRSKSFVCEKIAEKAADPEKEALIRRQVSEILFERDYSRVGELLAEFRKGEIQKKLDTETDPEKRLELMMEQAERRKRFRRRRRRKKSFGGP